MPEHEMPFGSDKGVSAFCQLPEFVQGYIHCLFWTEVHSDNEELEGATFEDLAPVTLQTILEVCEDFQKANAELLAVYCEEHGEEQAGHDFWLTRNRHGAGFWDRRGDSDVLRKLTLASHTYGECWVYRGDSGKLYLG